MRLWCERFRAPWGETYEDLQSKHLYELIDEPEPTLACFTLRDGVLTCERFAFCDSALRSFEVRSGSAHVYTFASKLERQEHFNEPMGWVEWLIEVKDGRLVSVTPVTMER